MNQRQPIWTVFELGTTSAGTKPEMSPAEFGNWVEMRWRMATVPAMGSGRSDFVDSVRNLVTTAEKRPV